MHAAWLGPSVEIRTGNVADAVSPEAIVTPGLQKLPIDDNDPTRNVPWRMQVLELLLTFVAVALLIALSVVSVVAVLQLT